MTQSVDFEGTNRTLLPPSGAENVIDLRVFNNGSCTVSCWELSDEELAQVSRSRQVFLSVFFGPTSPPVFVGSEETVRNLVVDFGGVWKRRPVKPIPPELDLCARCGVPKVAGASSLVLYFKNDQEREDFVRVFHQVKPDAKAIEI